MDGFDLPLKTDSTSAKHFVLSIRVDQQSRLLGGSEPWYQIALVRDGDQYDGAIATQPISCIQAVALGRKTAMMCKQGMLALQMAGNEIIVDFHTSGGEMIHALGSADGYVESISMLIEGAKQ